jgi:hypothetical protein
MSSTAAPARLPQLASGSPPKIAGGCCQPAGAGG